MRGHVIGSRFSCCSQHQSGRPSSPKALREQHCHPPAWGLAPVCTRPAGPRQMCGTDTGIVPLSLANTKAAAGSCCSVIGLPASAQTSPVSLCIVDRPLLPHRVNSGHPTLELTLTGPPLGQARVGQLPRSVRSSLQRGAPAEARAPSGFPCRSPELLSTLDSPSAGICQCLRGAGHSSAVQGTRRSRTHKSCIQRFAPHSHPNLSAPGGVGPRASRGQLLPGILTPGPLQREPESLADPEASIRLDPKANPPDPTASVPPDPKASPPHPGDSPPGRTTGRQTALSAAGSAHRHVR